mgnify:CR=1 FL=1
MGQTPTETPLEIIDPLCAVFRRRLREDGLKYTPERARLLDLVMQMEGLFDPASLLAHAARTGTRISKATLYRTIRLLLDAGIIQRVPLDDEHAHYHVVYGKAPSDLLIRLDTNEVVAVDLPEITRLRDTLCREMGLSAKGHSLQIFAVKAPESAPESASNPQASRPGRR